MTDFADGDGKAGAKPSQVSSRSLLWDVLFFWMSPTMFLGKKRKLQEADLPAFPAQDSVQALLGRKRLVSQATERDRMGQLLRAERFAFGLAGVAAMIYSTCQIVSPLALVSLLRVAEDGDYEAMPPYIVLFTCCQIGAALSNQWQLHLLTLVGQRMRVQLIGLVFRKALNVAPDQRPSAGHIVNLMSNDAQKVLEALPFIHKVWSSPLQIIVTAFFLTLLAGPSALIGIAVLFTLIPISNRIARMLQRARKEHLLCSDQRVKLCLEMLTGVRCIKYFAWERPYVGRILERRMQELFWVRRELLIFGGSMVVTVMGPTIAFAVVLGSGVFLDPASGVAASRSFGILLFMTGLRFPIMDLGSILATLVSLASAWKRIGAFMDRKEARLVVNEARGTEVLSLKACSVGYPSQEEAVAAVPTVAGLDLSLQIGELLVIEGRVGSGKSTLLQSIIGETSVFEGTMSVAGPLAYCAQHPWVLNATVKENILFGTAFDATWYEKVIEACCLVQDFLQWPAGDDTEVGERGVTLSGGQKQRLALARAVYRRDSKLVVLDDVFSALDAHTGQSVLHALFKLPGGLLRDRGVILAAHGATCIEYAQQVLTLAASPGSLTATCVLRKQEACAAAGFERTVSGKGTEALWEAYRGKSLARVSLASVDKADGAGALMTAEDREECGSSWAAVRAYIAGFGGVPWIAFAFITSSLERTFVAGEHWWIAKWSEDDPNLERPEFYLGVWAFILVIVACLVLLNRTTLAILGSRSAEAVFEQMTLQVMRAPVSWWDTTPLGRVINRFSFDTDMVDVTLVTKMFPAIISLSWMAGSVVVITGVLWPYSVLGIPVLAGSYLWLFQFSRKSIRELQRIDSLTRSPIQSVFAETMHGLSSVRAYQHEAHYTNMLAKQSDINGAAVISFYAASRWLGVRLESMAAMITCISSFGCWFAMDSLTPGLLGLCLVWSTNLTISLNFNCQYWSQAEAAFTSVQRMVAYAQEIPSEGLRPDLDGLSGRRPGNTSKSESIDNLHVVAPASGSSSKAVLRLEGVSLRYREGLPLALDDISFELKEGERMGVVGRTGSGKSTLAVALFRLTPLASGRVLLGDTNIEHMPLHKARQALGIITQDPVIFSGTVKYNLDPFNEFSDEDCAAALKQAQLAESLSLDSVVEEAGLNRSVGERQLMCLARALLRKPRVLVCDEATSSVDHKTDALVQGCLRHVSAALLTIAHRLETIADYDRVLVLDAGKVLELGRPHELLAKDDSAFSKLVNRLGDAPANTVRQIAAGAASENVQLSEKGVLAGRLSVPGEGCLAGRHTQSRWQPSACIFPPLLQLLG